jgi:pimeloyl-ACP methyl ester carboxylesterase
MAKFLIGLVVILLTIAIVGMAVTARYHSDMSAVQEHIDSLGSQVIEANFGPIEYAWIGEGYPVLVVHGNAGGFDQGLMLANWTVDPEFQVIAPSRFGYLRSPMPANASVAMQADDFACLLDSLGIKQAAVVAYSAGSTSAVQFALRHPERVSALILISPAAPGKGAMNITPKFVFDTVFRHDFVYWAAITYLGSSTQASWAGLPEGFALTPEEEAEVRTMLASLLPVSARADGSYFDTYVGTPEMLNSSENKDYQFGNIKTPTLVISAIDDPLALHGNARALADRIPGARLFSVPDGGHLILGHHEEVKSEVTQFLHSNVALLNNSNNSTANNTTKPMSYAGI